MADTTTLLSPDFADASTVTVVPNGTQYPCTGPGQPVNVSSEHVHDLLAAGWRLPQGMQAPPTPDVPQASGSVPGPDDPPPANPALEVQSNASGG